MRVLIIGGGGREHALAWRLAESRRVQTVYCAPGNAGTALHGTNLAIKATDISGLIAAAHGLCIDFTVVGPEAPLCDGIVDRFSAAGLRVFGPSAAAARIEGDKAYAKRLMKLAHVPTAEARIFETFESAREYIATRDTGVVIKASGLAAGKGVFVCEDPADGLLAAERIMVDRAFGDAGRTLIVEEKLKGEELSVFALVSGSTIYVLETAQDHKAVGDGDTGPNTGGMGAYSPAPIATPELMAKVEREILVPIVDAMRQDESPFKGLLYAGLMITAAGPKVLEFNCRFGDPEAQVVLMRLATDLADVLEAVVEERLDSLELRWDSRPAVGVVMASQGYPEAYESGKVITGLDAAAALEGVRVFHSGTSRVEHLVVSNGGRVLTVSAIGTDFADAQRRAYQAVDCIRFENAYCRRDIGWRAIGNHQTVR